MNDILNNHISQNEMNNKPLLFRSNTIQQSNHNRLDQQPQ